MNINNIPLEDGFETQLAQERDGGLGTVYLRTVPSFTFPSGIDTQITVNPGASNMQVVSIDSINTGNKTVNVSDITIKSGAGDTYAQSIHTVGSVVRISATFSQWEGVKNAVNSKIDGLEQGIYFYADTTARDAALGATPATDGLFVGTTSDQQLFYSAGGTRNPLSAGSSVVANASETVAGKEQLGTLAQGRAGTVTGSTGAPLSLTPDVIAQIVQEGARVYCASATGSDTYTANLTPSLTAYTTGMLLPCKFTTTNTGACSININSLGVKSIKTLDGNDPQTGVIRANGTALLMYDGTNFVIHTSDFATTSNKGDIEIATDAEVATGSDTSRATTPAQLRTNSKTSAGTTSRATSDSTGSQTIAHGLGIAPRLVEFRYVKLTDITSANAVGFGTYDGSTNRSLGIYDAGATQDYRIGSTVCIEWTNSSGVGRTATCTVDATNITLSWTKGGAGLDIGVMRTAHA